MFTFFSCQTPVVGQDSSQVGIDQDWTPETEVSNLEFLSSTPSPHITLFPLPWFELMQTLAYERISGGIPC